jgi:hypothetical protein
MSRFGPSRSRGYGRPAAVVTRRRQRVADGRPPTTPLFRPSATCRCRRRVHTPGSASTGPSGSRASHPGLSICRPLRGLGGCWRPEFPGLTPRAMHPSPPLGALLLFISPPPGLTSRALHVSPPLGALLLFISPPPGFTPRAMHPSPPLGARALHPSRLRCFPDQVSGGGSV